MTKIVLSAAVVGLALSMSGPTLAGSISSWEQELRSSNTWINPYLLPSEQLRRERSRLDD